MTWLEKRGDGADVEAGFPGKKHSREAGLAKRRSREQLASSRTGRLGACQARPHVVLPFRRDIQWKISTTDGRFVGGVTSTSRVGWMVDTSARSRW